MAQEYKVTLPQGFPYPQRTRLGVVVDKVNGYQGPLSSEQLEAIEADDYLTVEKVTKNDPNKPPAPKGPSKAEVKNLLARGLELGLELDPKGKPEDIATAVAEAEANLNDDESVSEVVDGIRYTTDGDQFCAVVDADFVNLQESPAGFGATQEEALAELKKQLDEKK